MKPKIKNKILKTKTQKFKNILTAVFLAATILFFSGVFPAKKAQAIVCTNCGTEITQLGRWIADKAWQAKEGALSSIRNFSLSSIASVQIWEKGDTLLQRALKIAWNNLKKQLLNEFASGILDWTQGENGYVYDWRGYLAQESDSAAQRFLSDEVDKAPMYENYASAVRQDVRSIDEYYERKSFSQKVGGPISQEEMNAFYNGDFTWDRWDAALQSNYYSDYFTALDDLAMTKESTYDAKKSQLEASQGFRGTESTPGPIAANAAERASMMDLDYLLQAADINEYLSSLVDAFINRIFKDGFKNTDFADYQPTGDPPQVFASQPAIDSSYAQSRYDYALRISDLLGLTDENLAIELQEQTANASLMNQINTTQDAIQAKENCQIATPNADPEILTLAKEISDVKTKKEIAAKAKKDAQKLILAMGEVITADRTGNAAALGPALEKFKTLHSQFIAELKTLFDTTASILEDMSFAAEQYNAKIIDRANTYTLNRGLADSSQANTLYWRLTQENAALAACLVGSSGSGSDGNVNPP